MEVIDTQADLQRFIDWIGSGSSVLALVIVALTVLVLVLSVSLHRARKAQRTAALTPRESDSKPHHRTEQELGFVVEFIGEFSKLLTELGSQKELRRVPSLLVTAMLRIFSAEQAVVVVRRSNTMTEPGRDKRLIVAGLASAERGLSVGTEIHMGEGHLGTVAQLGKVVGRADYEQNHAATAGDGPVFWLAAPMMANERTLGVVAFTRPHQRHARDEEILRMVARLGAMTWMNITAFRNAKAAADVDELTGIYNKRALKFKLGEILFAAGENGDRASAFMFDIDHFKNYNDVNGHLAGDSLLKSLAQLVRESVRADDIFGRFGGEEFLLILPGRTREQTFSAAEKIRLRIAGYDFRFGEKQPLGRLTVSGGVATFPDDATDSVELLRVADEALYRAKNESRNRVCKAVSGLNPDY